MAEFLFEIGLEEVPARMIAGAQAKLERRVVAMLERERLLWGKPKSKSFATPRRLAVIVHDVEETQNPLMVETLGPSTKVAYRDGVPTPAAISFAKKAGVEVEKLETVTTPKGEYVRVVSFTEPRTAAEVIAGEMPKELAGIYWAKNMYWRPGRPERFVRPVRWMVALLGAKTVPVSFGGYEAGAATYGHRVLFGEQAIALNSPGEYEQVLEKGFVIADVAVRRQKIRKALDAVTRTVGGTRWREDEELVETVTQLTEWPSVVMGSFEAEYLTLPEEVLVTVMRDHQKYFAVEDKDGKLAPHFLAVLNTQTDDVGLGIIRHGNERVLRARFNDARFFWEFDQRVPLVDRGELLKNVTFQKDLGSYAAKTTRVRKLASSLGGVVLQRKCELNPVALDEAATLAKTDLTTELVKEFTELQGIVGGLYARAQGFGAATADAIYDQYKPVSMEDSIPRTAEGAILAIADKADTIAGMFGLDMEPTGSKDPFALRRAANGVVKILAESATVLPLTLAEVVAATCGQNEALVAKVRGFFGERLEFYLREARNQAYDVVKAVLAAGADDVRDAVARAEAVTAVRGSSDFEAVSAAFKRMKNILAQAAEKGIAPGKNVNAALLTEETEKALAERSSELAGQVTVLRAEKNYRTALEQIATLRPQVDAFFESVMVMAPEPEVRTNRLALLEKVLRDFSGIADFSEIVSG
ncbi:MAG TPA: glycine--tRNA ligase subunit beta [Edaphobacter sp.]|nr:glycine--tRNA ligase subunit beta [Edaphobacter sp.]